MNTELLFNQGGVEVPNPQYNPRSKKNKVSPTIIVPDASATHGIADISFQNNPDLYQQYRYEDVKKYLNAGLAPNKISPNLDKELAESQSAWAKWGNAIAQTAVSEIALGTALAVTDILDGIFNAANSWLGGENDYQNPISQTLSQWQEKFRNEVAPIYTDPTKNISNGGLLDAGWWASNMPSIASSITLMLPSMGITGVAKGLLKGSNVASGTRSAVRAFTNRIGNRNLYRWANSPTTIEKANRGLELGANAALMRTMENYQEARQVYNDSYEDTSNKLREMSPEEYKELIENNKDILEGVDTSNRDKVAKRIAKLSADRTFQMDYANVIFDVMQLYALRDVFGKGRLSSIGRKSARKAQRRSLMYPGKSEAEIAELEKALPTKTKVKNWLSDNIVGGLGVIKAEASEGVEEAVNYIAQEEGMRVGKLILGEDAHSSFDSRLKKYVQAPQLWESAFWGLLGGVTFQEIGSGLQRVRQTIEDKNEEAKDKARADKTKESKHKAGWQMLSELPEVKRRVKDIENRSIKAAELASRLQLIDKQNINPFNVDKDGNPLPITNDINKEALRQRAIDEYRTDLTMSALNNGNYDMLKEYFANDNVRKYLVEQGVISEENSRAWQQETLQAMDNIKNEYDNQIFRLNDIAADSKKRVPIEYLQIAATNNVYQKQQIDNLRRSQSSYLNKFNNEKEELIAAGKLDGTLDYESAIQVSVIFNDLRELYDNRRQLRQRLKENPTIGNQIALDNVNAQIKALSRNLYDLNGSGQIDLARTMNILSNVRDYNASFGEIDQELEDAMDKAIASNNFKGIEDVLGLKRGTIKLSDEEYQNVINKYKDYNSVYKPAIDAITNANMDTASAYADYVELSHLINQAQKELIYTKEDLDNFTNVMNNTMDEARVKAIQESYDTLTQLSRKYGRNFVENAMSFYNRNDVDTFNKVVAGLTTDEQATFKDALDVLNFSNAANNDLYKSISNALREDERRQLEDEQDAVIVDEPQTSTTQNKPSQAVQSEQPITSSTEQNQAATAQANSQISDVSEQTNTAQTENQPVQTQSENTANNNGVISAVLTYENNNPVIRTRQEDTSVDKPIQLVPTTEPDTYEVEVEKDTLYNDTSLYDKEDGTSVIDNNYKVVRKPKVALDNGKYNIVEKGLVAPLNSTTPVEENAEPQSTTPKNSLQEAIKDKERERGINSEEVPTTSSTGGLEQPTPTESSQVSTPKGMSDNAVESNQEIVSLVAKTFGNFVDMFADEVDFDAAAQQVMDELKKQDLGLTDEQLNKLVTARKVALQQSFAFMKNLKDMKAKAAHEIAHDARYEENDAMQFSGMFYKAVEQFIREYAKSAIVPVDDEGKLVINMRSLLRQFRNSTGVTVDINNIYAILKNYLLKNRAFYSIEDIEDVLNDNVVKNIDKTAAEIHAEQNKQSNSIGIDINTTIRAANEIYNQQQREQFFNALDKIQIGDKLTLRRNSNGVIEITKNNILIGRLGSPKVLENGTFVQYNEGWRSDVTIDGKGNIVSTLKDIFSNFFLDDDIIYQNLRKIIQQAVLERDNISDKTLNKFANHPEIKSIIAQSKANRSNGNNLVYIDDKTGEPDVKNLLTHLVKLWRYTYLTDDSTSNKENIANNLESWFKKLYDTYTLVNNIIDNQDVTVSYITEGQVIRATEDNSKSNYKNLPLASEGLAPNSNAKIAIVNPRQPNIVSISGSATMEIYGWQGGSTVVALYSRNKQPDFVKAYGVSLADFDRTKVPVLDRMIKAIESKLNTTFTKLLENNNEENVNNVLDVISSIIPIGTRSNNKIPIFRATKGNFTISPVKFTNSPNIQGYQITYHDGNRKQDFQIFVHGTVVSQIGFSSTDGRQHWNNTQGAKVTGEQFAKAFIQFIQANCNINISLDGITSEGINKTTRNFGGFIQRTDDGKLRVNIQNNINNFDETYDSYSDYLIKNNLVRVNTRVVNKSNFSRRGENQQANQVLYVDVESGTTTPVEEMNDRPIYIAPNSIPKIFTSVRNILDFTPDNESVGLNLVGLFNEQARQALEALSTQLGVDLVPRRITFDNKINFNQDKKGVIASAVINKGNRSRPIINNEGKYARTSGGVNTVYVGTKFVNMFSDENRLRQAKAIRKLIHEQLHIIISDPTKVESRTALLNSIEEVYNEFKKQLSDFAAENANEQQMIDFCKQLFTIYENSIKRNADNPIRKESARLNLLEEFLVESITNSSLFHILNKMEATTDTSTQSKESLFTRIINAILKFFGWNVEQGSLFEQELEALRNAFNNNNQEELKTTEEVKEEINNTEQELTQEEEPSEESSNVNEDDWDLTDYDELDDITIDESDSEINPLDYDSNQSLYEEPDIDISNKVETSNVEQLVDRVPKAIRGKFAHSLRTGALNIRCR